MAQPDTITKDIPADGQVGVARVLQVVRDKADAEGWCSEAEELFERFMGIDVLTFERPGNYCCPDCSGGLSREEYVAKRKLTPPYPGYSYKRFDPAPGQAEFIPTTQFVKALKAAKKARASYSASLDFIGREVLGDLWIGFPTTWACYAERKLTIDLPAGRKPTKAEVKKALDAAIADLRANITPDKFYQD